MTQKFNADNGLQGRPTEHQPVAAVLRNGERRGKLNSIFQINICAWLTVKCSEIRHYAKPRYVATSVGSVNRDV